jgi:hypothetical protein
MVARRLRIAAAMLILRARRNEVNGRRARKRKRVTAFIKNLLGRNKQDSIGKKVVARFAIHSEALVAYIGGISFQKGIRLRVPSFNGS